LVSVVGVVVLPRRALRTGAAGASHGRCPAN
jgi:hypothetical protein